MLFWKAGIAQLVEYKLPKLGVASSNLVARSTKARLSGDRKAGRKALLSMCTFELFLLMVVCMN